MSVRAAISFKTFRREMGMETSIRVTISEACDLFTPTSKRYKALTTKINPINPVISLTMPRRKTNSDAAILLGGGGGVSGHDEMRGNIQEAESAGYGRQNIQYSCDSCCLFG